MAKKKLIKKTKSIVVSEPEVAYESNRIRIFKSFEEQEEDNLKWLASLTPEQHLYYGTLLIKRIFSEELKQNPTIGNRIKFD